ncbi:MAG: hypothetical protein K0S34_263 [Bacillales bacterium]|jgi:hypothetical protein|nr:hypothetical protein [Bacillales bacterium]
MKKLLILIALIFVVVYTIFGYKVDITTLPGFDIFIFKALYLVSYLVSWICFYTVVPITLLMFGYKTIKGYFAR